LRAGAAGGSARQLGLTDRVHQHWCRLFSAVFIGGALWGARQAVESNVATAAAAAQVAGGIAQNAYQIGRQKAGRRMDTRPTIEVMSGY
jgi:type IV secretory pathway VirB10-like protein